MISSTAGIGQGAHVIDLAYYRRRKTSLSMDQWSSDQEFFVTFAAYLRKRAGSVEVDSDGLERLAVAFDLRRIKLTSSLRSMLNEQYLTEQASAALDLAERLEDVLTFPTDRTSSVSTAAYQLAHALDMMAATLCTILPSTNYIR
jgi:hypothetical protein